MLFQRTAHDRRGAGIVLAGAVQMTAMMGSAFGRARSATKEQRERAAGMAHRTSKPRLS